MTAARVRIGPITRRVSIAGRVVDAETSRPLEGVEVVIRNRPVGTRTAEDGSFCFAGVPDGEHDLSFRLPGAGLRYGAPSPSPIVTVTEGASAPVLVKLPPTGIRGRAMLSASEAASYPLVQLVGSGEPIHGGKDGTFALLAVEPGPRTIVISAQGCEPFSKPATIVRGEVLDLGTVELVARPPRTSTLTTRSEP